MATDAERPTDGDAPRQPTPAPAPAPAPGLTFLITTNPREPKSAATKKRVRQAAALKSWRDIKSESASAGPAPKRAKTGSEKGKVSTARGRDSRPEAVTWEGVPAVHVPDHQSPVSQQHHRPDSILLPARPTNFVVATPASASSSSSTHTLSSLSSASLSPSVPTQSHETRHDAQLDALAPSARGSLQVPSSIASRRRRAQASAALLSTSSKISPVTPPAVGFPATPCSEDGRMRESYRHTIGWPPYGAGQLITSPRLPSIDDIVRHQQGVSQPNGSMAHGPPARKGHSEPSTPSSPCRTYCNDLDPFNCCPVKHKSWFDGVLHHMLTVFAPRAWPTLKITNEQGLQWEHFMTQHALAEPALYYVRLLFATGDMVVLNITKPQFRLWLQARALETINEALADPARATSDGLILAIGRIALNESLYGDKVAAHTLHRPAQQRMIAMRGGMNALDFPPLVKRLMRWSDKVMSMQGGTPRMIPDDVEPHYTDATSVDVLEKWAPTEGMALRKKVQLQAAP
ncbi:uncharacterized protein B0I36DRAFT_345664 [Microdochium trichocladiopsis]|uniref:Uncharacterized protein n=1 Tax=Microdochium trichocladiopsis TaxID=1682393 RepID=A0A9P8YGI5_9PEZI|nr:uncharacterized protein B0I36DRAFT_345664 [Microdochium trichocladiopsis]KAH7037569.1 hypothetical protein B0I36DRAFT_345664 [Microdochium trichocladiopsis]